LASWYPSKVHSTLGNFCKRHAEAIATLNNVTVLYIVQDKNLSENYSIIKKTENGLEEIICYYKTRGVFGIGYLKAYNYVYQRELKHRISGFHVVHVNVLYRAGYLAKQIHRMHKIPYVITEHWTGYHVNEGKNIGWIQKTLSRKIAANSKLILPVSEHLGKSMKAFGLKSHYRVVPNVVDVNLFKINKQKPLKFRFIHVSSLVDSHKNVSGIIRAFSKTKLNAKLEIIGDGDIKPYQTLANELGLTPEQFNIRGEQTLEEVAKSVSEAHCFILFSNYENQPCVIPEAHACGIPVIATDVGGIKEHLTILIIQKVLLLKNGL